MEIEAWRAAIKVYRERKDPRVPATQAPDAWTPQAHRCPSYEGDKPFRACGLQLLRSSLLVALRGHPDTSGACYQDR